MGFEFLIQNKIIVIPETIQIENTNGTQEVLTWIKNNASWWAQGMTTDNDFLKGIQFLVEKRIIVV